MAGRISRTAQYALRATVWLGARPPGARASAERIAAETQVPPAFLKKILRQLVAAGVLTSEKGHHGGFALARPRSEVSFLEVVRAVGADVRDDGCAFGWVACDHTRPCPLHHAFAELDLVMSGWAERHRLGKPEEDTG